MKIGRTRHETFKRTLAAKAEYIDGKILYGFIAYLSHGIYEGIFGEAKPMLLW